MFSFRCLTQILVDVAGVFLAELAAVRDVPENKLQLVAEGYKNIVRCRRNYWVLNVNDYNSAATR